MIFTTYQGAPLALLLAFPNWEKQLKVELQLPSAIDRAITALESRRVFSGAARYSLSYTAYLGSVDEAQRFRLWLLRLKGELLACPMWTDQCSLTQAYSAGANKLRIDSDWLPTRYGAEWIIINEDATTWEIITVTSISTTLGVQLIMPDGTVNAWGSGSFIYPLIFGRLDPSSRPQITAISDETASVDIKVQENSGFTHKLNPYPVTIPTVGANVPTLGALPLWSIYPKFEAPKDNAESDMLYKSVGFLRSDQQYVYGQGNRRGMELPFMAIGRNEMAAIEAFFVDRRGEARPFMIPTFRGDMRLTADAAGSIIPIEEDGKPGAFEDGSRPVNPGDPFVALTTFNLENMSLAPAIESVKLSSIDGAGLHTLHPIIGTHPKDATLVSHLLLARFSEPKLSWVYTTDGLATASIKFLELPNEYALSPSDLQRSAFIYRFTHQLDTPQTFLFTSYENQLVIPSGDFSGTYPPGPFDHETLKTSVKIDDEKVSIDSFWFTGSPLIMFFPFQLEAPLWLEVAEVDVDNLPATPTVLYTGEVWEVDATGQDVKADCLIFGRHLSKPFPSVNIQKVCNYGVYSSGPQCGVNKAANAKTGVITIVNPTTINVACGTFTPDDRFQIGFIEAGSGVHFERRAVMGCSAITGGLQVTIKFAFRFAVNGQSASVFPGCAGTIAHCLLFDNYSSQQGNARSGFFAFPFTPDINPTIKAMNVKNASSGKKG